MPFRRLGFCAQLRWFMIYSTSRGGVAVVWLFSGILFGIIHGWM